MRDMGNGITRFPPSREETVKKRGKGGSPIYILKKKGGEDSEIPVDIFKTKGFIHRKWERIIPSRKEGGECPT